MTPVHPPAVPAAALLGAWNARAWTGGVSLDELSALDRVTVRTRNSVYEIIVSSPARGDVLVRGGAFFPEFTRVRLAGATLGGGFLKLRSIHLGFRLEFNLGRRFVLTSPVEAIGVAAEVNAAG